MPDEDELNALAETVHDAIEEAHEQTEHAEATAAQIAEAAMEGERGHRIAELERRLDQWENSQSDLTEAITSTVSGLLELQGQMSVLLTQQQSPTQNLPSEEDGQKESPERQEPEIVVEMAEAPEPEPVAPVAPRKKRHNWI